MAVQGQLEENRRRARLGQRGVHFLLQGLLVCPLCGYEMYGKPVKAPAADGRRQEYAYYGRVGTDSYRFGGEKICTTQQVRTDLLDGPVWQEVCALLEDPRRVEQEYRQRLASMEGDEPRSLASQMGRVRQGLERLIDSYTEALIEKGEFEPRLMRL